MITGTIAACAAAAAILAPAAHQATTTHLAPNPVWTQLQSSQATAWSRAALTAAGAPATTANLRTMRDWYLNEGIPHNYNNPLNLETPYGGSWAATEDGDPLTYHIQHYPVPADFPAAFAIEMRDPRYPVILWHLRHGTGLEGNQGTPRVRRELWEYSGDGYRTIPAAYCPC